MPVAYMIPEGSNTMSNRSLKDAEPYAVAGDVLKLSIDNHGLAVFYRSGDDSHHQTYLKTGTSLHFKKVPPELREQLCVRERFTALFQKGADRPIEADRAFDRIQLTDHRWVEMTEIVHMQGAYNILITVLGVHECWVPVEDISVQHRLFERV